MYPDALPETPIDLFDILNSDELGLQEELWALIDIYGNGTLELVTLYCSRRCPNQEYSNPLEGMPHLTKRQRELIHNFICNCRHFTEIGRFGDSP